MAFIGDYSENVLEKARGIDPATILTTPTDPTVHYVTSVRTGKKERVQFVGDEWVTCSCINGGRRGGKPSCYHAAAVELKREEERQ